MVPSNGGDRWDDIFSIRLLSALQRLLYLLFCEMGDLVGELPTFPGRENPVCLRSYCKRILALHVYRTIHPLVSDNLVS